MNLLVRVCFATVVSVESVLCLPAHAESLRCNGHIVDIGDSALSVRYHCGEPLLKDSYCAPLYYFSWLQPVPEPFASAIVPCQKLDAWLYDRGPGNLVATVRLRAGLVLSITYDPRAGP